MGRESEKYITRIVTAEELSRAWLENEPLVTTSNKSFGGI